MFPSIRIFLLSSLFLKKKTFKKASSDNCTCKFSQNPRLTKTPGLANLETDCSASQSSELGNSFVYLKSHRKKEFLDTACQCCLLCHSSPEQTQKYN